MIFQVFNCFNLFMRRKDFHEMSASFHGPARETGNDLVRRSSCPGTAVGDMTCGRPIAARRTRTLPWPRAPGSPSDGALWQAAAQERAR